MQSLQTGAEIGGEEMVKPMIERAPREIEILQGVTIPFPFPCYPPIHLATTQLTHSFPYSIPYSTMADGMESSFVSILVYFAILPALPAPLPP